MPVSGTEKRNRLTEFEAVSSSTLVATVVDTKKELGLLESESEKRRKELAGYGRWVHSDQSEFSVDFVTSVHVYPKSYATYATFVSQSLGYARGGVQRDESARRSVHSESLRCRL